MNNELSINAPSISTVDNDGVTWTYDPKSQKWFAAIEGKKFNSKDYPQVREKMNAHLVGGGAQSSKTSAQVAETPLVVEVAMLCIRLETIHRQSIDFTSEKIRVEPITAKIEWDVENAKPHIVRYKEKEGGWKKFNSESLILFHPNFMDASMRKFFDRSIEGRMLRQSFEKSEAAIAKSWWDMKAETRISYRIGKDGFVRDDSENKIGHLSNGVVVSSSWPLSIPKDIDNPSFDKWEQGDDGSLKRGDVKVVMDLSKGHSPNFNVHAKGYDHSIFTSGDLRTALIIGDATFEMLATPGRQTVQTWSATKEWTGTNGSGWPQMLDVDWALAMPQKDLHRSNYVPATYFFGRYPNAKEAKYMASFNEQDPSKLGWHNISPSYGRRDYRLIGSEDRVLDTMKSLREKFSLLGEEHSLVNIERDQISQMFSSTLPDLYNAVIDGEEETTIDPSKAKAAFDNMTKNIVKQIEGRGLVEKWQTQCNDAVRDVEKILSKYAQPISARPPKPR